ncbi:5-methyltetrahydropteroyltriglutamate-homocysteine S-methyltransferase [Enterococcus haemoperoxidus ATCC BAA-382]|uniref:5-methyltetrahydropteroyltriglutamate--homocysteine methyltransferase n=1 Tax=Enterococcus haemoperoxidus ATCC BAA-382 TaxID=1158608 RepID=R2QE90_9ENTE|nr:5-methyltetrahydropteroyltriglutamate--homocysteine S-methyltransferase [Enterococcus haemoperoxidus]EOH93548.1 5-methyltetrahydropteroyltriglutamate-homocysteine S-methyltransferase [Enterococcus haemoperoxidus ATCC BAA-382]EOT63383.1 5-methyltetrahydropteroyltriglutamate-homocysteine S-methyltransferase [Enterococcus haemoperoxidus ATCC BAA-382]OJG50759.1 5-methyltetrahydropteroyltriglutamate-homocysteine S-methyltransferase [Enterococcus haemoperoxidus]
MKTSIIGFPRVGESRELKFATERYFRKEITADELEATGKELRNKHWQLLVDQGIDFIPSGDFSFFDTTLDTAILLNIVPTKYQALKLTPLETYFALARGYQGEEGDVTALAMKKWFNTNYHYMVPEIEDDTELKLVGDQIFRSFDEAKEAGIITRPTILGPFTLLKLATYQGSKRAGDFYEAAILAYAQIFEKLSERDCEWLQIDEPALVLDLSPIEVKQFKALYQKLLAKKGNLNIVAQTYFGDVRDAYQELVELPFDGIGLDFIEGRKTLSLLETYGFPKDKLLFAGIINGKNIWKNNYQQTLALLKKIKPFGEVVLNTSCSLLHVPFTLDNESTLSKDVKDHFAFAVEKLAELNDLKKIMADNDGNQVFLRENRALFDQERFSKNEQVAKRIKALTEKDFVRLPALMKRAVVQKDKLKLPILPTTTIGSFPQTKEVKQNRAKFKKGEISEYEYKVFNQAKIAECIAFQEEIGLDVLVHGEFERNDMVEYFGESLDGYLFTEKAWVQSYGTRCVKPPIIWGDISRSKPITVAYSKYAQTLTEKPMKGMLTGPVTILNWSFPREDISLRESTLQLALAIQEEVLDLEANGIGIIQIDEAALREKLPLRKSDWHSEYLDWAIPAFRLVHSKVQPTTQIHTHMCYSEFADIIQDIDNMDADVISFEASRSNLDILDALKAIDFQTQVGPGVYDIHSPRVPSVKEIEATIHNILKKLPIEKVWVNPDCGLKTRGVPETQASLKNLTLAAKKVRGGV